MDIKSVISDALNSGVVQDPTHKIMLGGLAQLNNDEILQYLQQQLQLMPPEHIGPAIEGMLAGFPPEVRPQMQAACLQVYNFLKQGQAPPNPQ